MTIQRPSTDFRASTSRIALVTGGTNGIGAATASLLADRGIQVVVADIAAPADGSLPEGAEFVALDVASEQGWNDVVTGVVDRHGGIDVLVNAAGIEGDVSRGTLDLTSLEEWHRVLGVNLDGTFLGCRTVMPVMKAGRGGSIVNVSSLAAFYPTTYSVAYGASKGAVCQLTKTVALVGSEGPVKVRCNSVHPGIIATRMIDSITAGLQAASDAATTAAAEQYFARIPVGRPGSPSEAAAVIAFLASDEATYITGSEYLVDGGSHLQR
ncbi:SDR family oxidoreductase [Streptomyces sp. NPDC001833]|uniref:SDR family NAD(P)-dependent oxidoreductase n=1 Tax=Streptomyces sp. NPDC001833 TaxID=3154658 RepID=UPI003332AE9B